MRDTAPKPSVSLSLANQRSPNEIAHDLQQNGFFDALKSTTRIDWYDAWADLESIKQLIGGAGQLAPRFCTALEQARECQNALLKASLHPKAARLTGTLDKSGSDTKTPSGFTFFQFEDAFGELLDLHTALHRSRLFRGKLSEFKTCLGKLLEHLDGGVDDFIHTPMCVAERYIKLQNTDASLPKSMSDLELADILIAHEGVDSMTTRIARHFFEYSLADIHWSKRAKECLTLTQAFILEAKQKMIEDFYILHDEDDEVVIEIPNAIDREHAKLLFSLLCTENAQTKLTRHVERFEWRPDPCPKSSLEFEFKDESLILRAKAV